MIATPQEVEQYKSDTSSLAQMKADELFYFPDGERSPENDVLWTKLHCERQARVDAYEEKYLPRRSSPRLQKEHRADYVPARNFGSMLGLLPPQQQAATCQSRLVDQAVPLPKPKPRANLSEWRAHELSESPSPRAPVDLERFRANEPAKQKRVNLDEFRAHEPAARTQKPKRVNLDEFRAHEPAAPAQKPKRVDLREFRAHEPAARTQKPKRVNLDEFRAHEPAAPAQKTKRLNLDEFRAHEPKGKQDVDMGDELAASPTRQDEVPEESGAAAKEDDVDIFMDDEDELTASPTRQEDSAASPSAAPVTENWGRGDEPEDHVLYSGEESEHEDWNPATKRVEKKGGE
ncbi:hypothetical protein SNOG_14220 [Parastagonospora nodorum SN15]|uniref:Uncharacterized protein n=1 Tax=Phaeosphaeria nodorum (strain SN15 / ATCC MYA-4574 / FGSC 10173) TaxID=321614 RepID=Q0U246_PHANO|nr:hypothetical protein SNOG_14220 [Parastagonospora nodorum SN15]EAT78457.2 hypothetical protein SNOG_14220 [Parastagonospora nodorum SN15]